MSTILAVDDSPSVRKMVEAALRAARHDVVTAEDGQEALETLERRGTFDLMVFDVNMPRLDGLSLLRAVRERSEWAAIPVLMLTTEGEDSDRERALSLGATDYMIKPFKPGELIKRVATLLAARS
jgi:two-component system, chemotaxis family, chemotaxis protein CheY